MFMTFSGNPHIVRVTGNTLEEKLIGINASEWGMNTNLELAFDNILAIAIDNHVPRNEIVKSIIVISDMEIDQCSDDDWSFYDAMKRRFENNGYDIPNIVFWNVDLRHDVFHADSQRKGVQLCSGQSATTFKQLMGCIGMTPVEMMLKVINSDRYAEITVES
jgi:hypothetical protein